MLASARPRSVLLLLPLLACGSEGDATTGTGTDTGANSTTDPGTAAPDPTTGPALPGDSTTGPATTGPGTTGPATTEDSTTGEPFAPTLLLPRASILPAELAVLANDQDAQSMAVAAYYLERRKIPAQNLITLSFPPGDVLAADVFAGLKGQIDAALGPEIQAIAVAWTGPYRVDCQSLVSALALGHDPALYCSVPCAATAASGFFDSPSTRPYTDHGLRPAMHLAGVDIDAVRALIDRGVASDGAHPTGVGYFVRTTDAARSVRWESFLATVQQWSHPGGLAMQYLDNSAGAGLDYLEDARDVLFYFTGLASVPAIDSNTFVPGAVADHLTSYGGQICQSGQMSLCRWLEAGATGSYGTAVEPCNYTTKFPETSVFVPHYFRGETLIEAYWKSVAWPGEGVFAGEPLARPWGGAEVEYDPAEQLLTFRSTQFVPGLEYAIESGPTDQGPWTSHSSFVVAQHERAEIVIPGASAAFYRVLPPA